MSNLQYWRAKVAELDYSFHPIVGIQTGGCVAAEAVLSPGCTEAADRLMAQAKQDHAESILVFALQERALGCFAALGQPPTTRLLIDMGTDLQATRASVTGPLRKAAEELNIAPETLCLTCSEAVALADMENACSLFDATRRAGFTVAVDRFGGSAASLKLLLEARPDLIRLERKLVAGVVKDALKRALVHHAVAFAHLLGALILADGVTTAPDFMVVRDLEIDWVQGPLLGTEHTELQARYEIVGELRRADRRERTTGALTSDMIETLQPLPVTTPMTSVLEFFRGSAAAGIATVVDEFHRPLGLIRERDLRDLVYSRFGGELLRNRAVGGRLRDFVAPCPVIEASAQIDRLLDLFTRADASDGIIITRDQRYVGYLSAATLVRLAHDRHVVMARDQNPLTKLPGNNMIAEHIESALTEAGRLVHLVYFDFDSFKPFNDSLGFRQGDRAILMFADIMQSAPVANRFIGHVGGDDFFLSVLDVEAEAAIETVNMLQTKFKRDAESLYDADSRAAGSIRAKDRDGKMRDFPLLSVSAVMVSLPADRESLTPDQITRAIADGKGPAKATGFCHLHLQPAPATTASRELEEAAG